MTDALAHEPEAGDGKVRSPEPQADILAIQELAITYGHAVDDRDWTRWQALFTPDAHIDYLHSGGIAGSPAELAAWMPDALGMFSWSSRSVLIAARTAPERTARSCSGCRTRASEASTSTARTAT